MKNKIINYQLISASGNPTAIVSSNYNPNIKKQIVNQIFLKNPKVEQIGFLYNKNKKPYFEMMGQEFCGNGCRSAAYILKNSPTFKTTGTNKLIESKTSNISSQIKIPYQFNSKKLISIKPYFSIRILKSIQMVILQKDNLALAKKIINSDYPAAKGIGIMFINKFNNKYYLTPYFYTKATNTFIKETACGSGTATVGIYFSYLKKQSLNNFKVIQPSNKPIFVSTKYNNISNSISNILISGPTKLLGDYNVKINL